MFLTDWRLVTTRDVNKSRLLLLWVKAGGTPVESIIEGVFLIIQEKASKLFEVYGWKKFLLKISTS